MEACVWRRVSVLAVLSLATPDDAFVHARQTRDRPDANPPLSISLKVGSARTHALGLRAAGETYGLLVATGGGPLGVDDRVEVELPGAGTDRISKDLHAGDPDFYLPYRAREDGQARLSLARTGQRTSAAICRCASRGTHVQLAEADRAAIEAEPNDSWQAGE